MPVSIDNTYSMPFPRPPDIDSMWKPQNRTFNCINQQEQIMRQTLGNWQNPQMNPIQNPIQNPRWNPPSHQYQVTPSNYKVSIASAINYNLNYFVAPC